MNYQWVERFISGFQILPTINKEGNRKYEWNYKHTRSRYWFDTEEECVEDFFKSIEDITLNP